jgi:hypothetical protein
MFGKGGMEPAKGSVDEKEPCRKIRVGRKTGKALQQSPEALYQSDLACFVVR